MKILGIDPGNFNTKTSEGKYYPSKIKKDLSLADKDSSYYVVFNGQEILIGDGEYETDPRKMDKEMYVANILAAAARSCPSENDFSIVTGLPACHYNELNVKKVKDMFKEKVFTIKVENKERVLTIENIAVYSENAAPYQCLNAEDKAAVGPKDLIIVNIGGGNTNIAQYKVENNKRKLVKQKTLMIGMLNMYSDFVDLINSQYPTNYQLEDAENLVRNGLELFDKKEDIEFAYKPFTTYSETILKELNNFHYQTSKVILTGGGVTDLKSIFIKKIPHLTVQNNNLFATAIGFKEVGEKLWLNK